MKHIGGGTAHVETNHRLQGQPGQQQGLAGHGDGAHHAAGGPRQDRVLGVKQGALSQRSTGAHHPQGHRPVQGGLQLIEVAVQHRRHRRLHQGGLAAGHQPRQAAEPMRQTDCLRLQRLQPGREALLMAGITVAVQQRNGTTAVAISHRLKHLLLQLGVDLQGLQLTAIGRQTTSHLNHPQLQRHRTLHRLGKQIGPMQITDGEQIGESPVDQQQHRRTAVLEQGIGGHGGAEPQLLDQARWQGLIQRHPHQLGNRPDRWISLKAWLLRQHLAHQALSPRSKRHHIGERAAAVDPDSPAGRRTRFIRRAQLSGSSQTAAAPRRPGP